MRGVARGGGGRQPAAGGAAAGAALGVRGAMGAGLVTGWGAARRWAGGICAGC